MKIVRSDAEKNLAGTHFTVNIRSDDSRYMPSFDVSISSINAVLTRRIANFVEAELNEYIKKGE